MCGIRKKKGKSIGWYRWMPTYNRCHKTTWQVKRVFKQLSSIFLAVINAFSFFRQNFRCHWKISINKILFVFFCLGLFCFILFLFFNCWVSPSSLIFKVYNGGLGALAFLQLLLLQPWVAEEFYQFTISHLLMTKYI